MIAVVATAAVMVVATAAVTGSVIWSVSLTLAYTRWYGKRRALALLTRNRCLEMAEKDRTAELDRLVEENRPIEDGRPVDQEDSMLARGRTYTVLGAVFCQIPEPNIEILSSVMQLMRIGVCGVPWACDT